MTFKWAPRVTSASDYFVYSGTRYLMTQKSNFWCHLITYPSPGMESWWALPHKSFQNHLSGWEALGGSLKRELLCDIQYLASDFSGILSCPAYSLCYQQFCQYLSVMCLHAEKGSLRNRISPFYHTLESSGAWVESYYCASLFGRAKNQLQWRIFSCTFVLIVIFPKPLFFYASQKHPK